MLKLTPAKTKPPPWIPAGRGQAQPKKTATFVKHPTRYEVIKIKSDPSISPKPSPWKAVIDNTRKEVPDPEADTSSVSSHSSHGIPEEIDIHLIAVLKEMKLLYTHFASIKTSYLSMHRLIDSQDVEQSSSIKDLFLECEVYIKKLNELFDDLEYTVSVYENTLNENLKKIEYLTVLKNKEKLLLSILEMYEKVIRVLQTVFEKQNYTELRQLKDALSNKLKAAEKKCVTQEAVIKDLERRLSIHQSKVDTLDSYRRNVEDTNVELEKQLLHKETQIKYLSNELKNVSEKVTKSDEADIIDIIESVQQKAHADKSALKKALKYQQEKFKALQEKHQKSLQESNEKEKIIMDLAAERDMLRVQLTVSHNNIIELRNQIEEMKIQSLKHQNEINEKNTSYKNEILQLKDDLDEKSFEKKKFIKIKTKLEETIEELENELKISKKQTKASDSSEVLDKAKEVDVLYEEMHRLVSLLQNTNRTFENFKLSSHSIFAGGDHVTDMSEYESIQREILSTVKEAKKYVLELKNLFNAGQKELPEQRRSMKNSESERQLKQMERDNQALKQELEELKSAASSNSLSHKSRDYLTSKSAGDNFTRKLQLELVKKSEEISNKTHEFQQRERDLENQLRECKDRLRALESDNSKTLRLEEELRETKLELSLLRRTSDEEKDKLLQRTKELQDSLDLRNAEFETLEKYVELLKSTYYNVFNDSRIDF